MIVNAVKIVSLVVFGILFLAATFAMIVLGTVLVPLRVAWDFSDEIADWIAERYGRLIEWTTP